MTGAAPVLLLGGTAEARALARSLGPREDVHLVLSLAGVTRAPARTAADEVRRGGFGGAAGLAAWLRERGARAVLDATHPFAAGMAAAAAEGAAAAGVPRLHVRRAPWPPVPGDDRHEVADLATAAELAPRLGGRVLLALGGGGAASFAAVEDAWFLVRAIDTPAGALPPRHEVVLGRGPFSVDDEIALLRRHRVEVVVARDSGADATRAKLDAARELGLPVVLVRRPPPPDGPVAASADDALAWLERTLGRA